MLSTADLEHLQKVARHHARKLTHDKHEQEDIAQAGLMAAVKSVQRAGLQDPMAWAATHLRYGCSREAARLRRTRPRVVQLDGDQRRSRGPRTDRHLHLPDPAAIAELPRLKDVVRDLYRRALVATGFRVADAAKAIGVGRATMFRAVLADKTLLDRTCPPTS